jgi:ribosomal protein L17
VPESKLMESIRKFLDDMATDVIEERVVDYVVREVRSGRKLAEALHDPYVKNRLSEEKLAQVLGKPEVIDAIEQQIASAFGKREFGFRD